MRDSRFMDAAAEAPESLAFGRFRVLPQQRELLADGEPIKLGGRAFDVLMALIEARGAVISKDALMAQVWPDRIVEENNLSAHILTLRKAFGPDRQLIQTVYGRGYRFIGEIGTAPLSAERQITSRVTATETAPQTNLPQPVSELIGRDEELREILEFATAHRLVTLTGAGGIGKTQLALSVARRLLPQFAGGAWVIELAPLNDPDLVPTAVAAAVGIALAGGAASPERVANALTGRELLVVLDNCEHVIEAAAIMAETLLQANPAAHVVATSREALKAECEWVYSVPSLAVPAANRSDQEDLLQYGAMRLFIERAQAAGHHFTPDRNNAASIAAICRRLDGIPLAIELAAARAAALGIEGLAARLDDRFDLLTGGRRTALPRHQTLRATLDWSYELLREPERVVLRRLAIFAGGFTLEAANAVAVGDEIAASDVVDCVANLVAKSLVTADADGTRLHYRLLETTRAYALQKLEESGERAVCARRHARQCLTAMEAAQAAWEHLPAETWLARHRQLIDDVRAALDFSIRNEDEGATAVSLTVAATPLWYQLSLLTEGYERASRALALPAIARNPTQEMRLYAAVAWYLMQIRGGVQESQDTWTLVLALARANNDVEHQLRALWGLWAAQTSVGALRPALALAQEFSVLARQGSDIDRGVGDRMMGHSLHLLGEQSAAREHLDRMLANYTPPASGAQAIRYIFDQETLALCFLSRISWLQGCPDQAMRIAYDVTNSERARGDALSLCQVLVQAACPIGLMVGDLAAVEEFVSELMELSVRHDWQFWRAFGTCFRAVLIVQRGYTAVGLHLLEEALSGLRNIDFGVHYLYFLCQYASALGLAGRIEHGLDAIEQAAARSDHNDERWCTAEVLRIKGDLLHRQGEFEAADAAFTAAKEWAEQQGAISWSLRIATSTARLWQDMGCATTARAELAAVCARFTEGFDTADYRGARAVLHRLDAEIVER